MSLPRDVYTIRNKGSGTFTDLSGGTFIRNCGIHSSGPASYTSTGSNTNGAQVQGWEDEGASASFSFNQRWLITPVNGTPGSYKMQNLHSGTFVDLSNGSPSNDTKIQGWEGSVNDTNKNQQWVISGAEVAGFWR
jgi:Ricin-type beta-trefoil lectin domain-like